MRYNDKSYSLILWFHSYSCRVHLLPCDSRSSCTFFFTCTPIKPPLQWVFICREPTTEHLHEICSLLWGGGFVNIRWRKRPGLGIIEGIVTIFSTAIFLFFQIELFTLSRRERKWREKWLCGCLMPSIFLCRCGFSSVSNPARAPAAPGMASPKAQDTSPLNYPFLPTQPTRPALCQRPPWPGCSWWSQVHTVGVIAVTVVFFWLSAGTSSYLACCTRSPQIGLWQADSQTGWLPRWLSGPITRSL